MGFASEGFRGRKLNDRRRVAICNFVVSSSPEQLCSNFSVLYRRSITTQTYEKHVVTFCSRIQCLSNSRRHGVVGTVAAPSFKLFTPRITE